MGVRPSRKLGEVRTREEGRGTRIMIYKTWRRGRWEHAQESSETQVARFSSPKDNTKLENKIKRGKCRDGTGTSNLYKSTKVNGENMPT